ncbi:(deoxy)nucleoside triphosphate pyrophosphohydrolase [Microbacterium sp.]|uniref:(deoxy)nucleoside triphosphate pyrophosphohydrolase n=1 Tax=Microbacterium sp. TaxID=51671 RepID=UPI0039E6889B
MRRIDVVGAVLVGDDGRVLAAQRGPGRALAGSWEFPGGKIEPGEDPSAALRRELIEELGCVVAVGGLVTTTIHEYDFGIVTLTTYYCTLVSGTPRATEHSRLRWMPASALPTLDWAPADLPAVACVVARADGCRHPSPATPPDRLGAHRPIAGE